MKRCIVLGFIAILLLLTPFLVTFFALGWMMRGVVACWHQLFGSQPQSAPVRSG